MENRQAAICVVLGGMVLGMGSLAFRPVRDFADGFLGLPPSSRGDAWATAIDPDHAAHELRKPLQRSEFAELFKGVSYHAHARYGEAIPIIGKYAMRGDAMAQALIGAMYAFGQGLPIDRAAALRWLTLAADQGNRGAMEFAAHIKATTDWERRAAAVAYLTNADPSASQPVEAPQQEGWERPLPADQGRQLSVQSPSYADPQYGPVSPYGRGVVVSPNGSIGARASVEGAYGSGSASRGRSSALASIPAGGDPSPIILNQAGPGTYSAGNGDIYTQAGPHGVINTRTGEFSPTN